MRRIIIDRTPRTVALENFVAEGVAKPKRRKPLPLGAKQFEQLLTDTNAMKDEQAWGEFEPKHFIALYCLLHAHVYGVVPEEVRREFSQAKQRVKLVLKDEFNGNAEAFIDFMRWAWVREAKDLPNRAADNTFRIGWRYQFCDRLVSDYRVAILRNAKRKP